MARVKLLVHCEIDQSESGTRERESVCERESVGMYRRTLVHRINTAIPYTYTYRMCQKVNGNWRAV